MKYLTFNELINGEYAGIHIVDKPIRGYKKIKCCCSKSNIESDAIAHLEIPAESLIVRPYLDFYDVGSEKLRADTAIVLKIDSPINNCKCYSYYDSQFAYNQGEIHYPDQQFELDLHEEYGAGIYFYLDIDSAKKCNNI